MKGKILLNAFFLSSKFFFLFAEITTIIVNKNTGGYTIVKSFTQIYIQN